MRTLTAVLSSVVALALAGTTFSAAAAPGQAGYHRQVVHHHHHHRHHRHVAHRVVRR